jgi:glucose-6-phosphate-specific signal transduction histidine kinase
MAFERFVLPVLLIVLIVVAMFRGFQEAVLSGILAMLVVLAIFVQRGFNEVIKGLESLDRRLNRPV